MNLGPLRFAKAAAEERSFSKAAEKCNVTQPTLSNGIALLEEEVGGRLFARTTRRVDLTPFGAQLLPLIEAAWYIHKRSAPHTTQPCLGHVRGRQP